MWAAIINFTNLGEAGETPAQYRYGIEPILEIASVAIKVNF